MAKKKYTNKKTTPNEKKVSKPMIEKVSVKRPQQDNENISRIIGSIFIGLGILLVAFGIYSYIQYRQDPVYEQTLKAPTITELTEMTNDESFVVRGEASEYDQVVIYVNDKEVERKNIDNDGKYIYEHPVEDQGEYTVSVAGLKGFPVRNISPKSEIKKVVVDWEAPSSDVKLVYGEETNKNTFAVQGETEPNATVTLKRGTEEYNTTSNEEGKFLIEEIGIEEGKNVFLVEVKDSAGNITKLDEKIRIAYNPEGDINGDSVIDVAGTSDSIPQADGEIDILVGNIIMFIFGVLAIIGFTSSSVYMYRKNN